MKNINLIIISISLLASVGCKKSQDGTPSHTFITTGYVAIEQVPHGATITGNIDILPVIFNIKASKVKVWVKPSRNESWSEIEALRTDGAPTYILDTLHQQLRFKYCYEAWAYAVQIIE